MIKAWELDILQEQVKVEMFQVPPEMLPPNAVDVYISDVIESVSAGKAWIVGFEDLQVMFLVWPKSYFVATIHFWGRGGTWGTLKAFKRFISTAFDYLPTIVQRLETKVHAPSILALVSRTSMTYDGFQRKAFWGGGIPQDEHVFSFLREEPSDDPKIGI